MSALQGLRVIELSHAHGAFAGKLLGDMGADVILIEPPGGDAMRGHGPFQDDIPGPERSLTWWHYHTSKRGIVLDLDSEAGRAYFRKLIATADILLEAEPRTRLASLGLDYADLKAIRPDLIHVAITPFGREDAKSDLPVTDLTIMAGGGPAWSCGYDDHSLPPIRGGGNQGFHTACHYAVMGLLTAVLHRMLTGVGQFIDVSMHAAQNVTTEGASYGWMVNRSTLQRQTGRHAATRQTGESQMRCADGRYVNTGVPPRFPQEFARLHGWMTKLGMVDDFPEAVFLEMGANWEGHFDLTRIGSDDTITAIFAAGREALMHIAARVPAYDFFVGCQGAGLTVGVIYSPEEAYEDAHFKARGFQVEVEHPELGRSIRYPGAPYVLPASPWAISRRAPLLGEHTAEVLGAL